MKIEVSLSTLLTACKTLKKFTMKYGPLSNVKITATDTVYIEATNNEMACRINIDGTIHSQGQALLDVVTALNVLCTLKSQNATLEFENGTCKVADIMYPNQTITIENDEPVEYPDIEYTRPDAGYHVMGQTFINAIKTTVRHTSNDIIKPVFNGVLFDNKENVFTMVGTDSKRLAMVQLDTTDLLFHHIVPRDFLNAIASFIPKKEPVYVSFADDNHICISRTIDGQFPNYMQVVPKESEYVFSLQRDKLLEYAQRACKVLNETGKSTWQVFRKLVVDIKVDKATMSATYDIDYIKTPEHLEPFFIGLNMFYVKDALELITTANVMISLKSMLSPVTIGPDTTGLLDETMTTTVVIMPIQIRIEEEERESA